MEDNSHRPVLPYVVFGLAIGVILGFAVIGPALVATLK